MKRINKENKFLIIWLMCVFLLICVCNFSFFKETWAAFGDVTGQLSVPYTIKYIANYPEELGFSDDNVVINYKGSSYTIMANEFILSGYEFVNWNSLKDGTGNVYNPNDVITIDKNLTFYAQWKKVEIIKISYGDINLDGIVNDNDYLLLEQYVTLGTGVDERGLSNADVNVDGKIDLVDVDIIKQVCLGTEGYIGMLPNNPILVYEFYNNNNNNSEPESGTDVNDGNISGVEDNKDGEDSNLENGDQLQNGDSSSDGNDDSSSDNSGSSSTNSSSSASGNASNEGSSNNAGIGSESKPSSGSSSKPSNDNSSSNSGNDHGNSSSNEIENEDLSNNSTDNFIDDIITGEQSANKDEANELQIVTKPNNIYVAIIVLGIFLLAIRLVIYIINKFRQKEKNI